MPEWAADGWESTNPNKPDEVIDEEQVRCWTLRLQGYDADEIARRLGLSRRTVYRRINDSILAQQLPTRDHARLISHARQERYLSIISDYLDRELEPADAARFVTEARLLDREQRRMLGLDEPVRTHTTVSAGDGDEPPVPEVLELIERMERENGAVDRPGA